jgi:hypothetical protein
LVLDRFEFLLNKFGKLGLSLIPKRLKDSREKVAAILKSLSPEVFALE